VVQGGEVEEDFLPEVVLVEEEVVVGVDFLQEGGVEEHLEAVEAPEVEEGEGEEEWGEERRWWWSLTDMREYSLQGERRMLW